jgi:hypothetical protein
MSKPRDWRLRFSAASVSGPTVIFRIPVFDLHDLDLPE